MEQAWRGRAAATSMGLRLEDPKTGLPLGTKEIGGRPRWVTPFALQDAMGENNFYARACARSISSVREAVERI